MKKGQVAEQTARIEAVIARWQPHLALQDVDIEHVYVPTCRDDDADCQADTDAQWQYRTARIRYYLPHFQTLDDDDMEATIVHELVHVLIAPMESQLDDAKIQFCELAVENITRALLVCKGISRSL